MLDFKQGDPNSPGGNLLVYCKVIGRNPIHPGGEYLACNVMVSFITSNPANLPVVIFPPISVETEEELQKMIPLLGPADIVRIEDFEIPPHQSDEDYMTERIEAFNDQVMEYVELCRMYLEEMHEKELPGQLELFPEDAADKLTDIWSGTSKNKNAKSPKTRQPENKIESLDEQTALEQLENLYGSGENPAKLARVIHFMEENFPKYDVRNFAKNMDRSDLSHLYLRKFQAILHEKYEDAADIQSRIRKLELRSSRT